jgi:hypothetical protein
MSNRKLNLRREVLTELTPGELTKVVGGATDGCNSYGCPVSYTCNDSYTCPVTFSLLCLYYTQGC